MKLKIFSDRGYLAPGIGHAIMLFPFWGKGHPGNGRFEAYTQMGRSLFEMTSLEEADLAVMPADWELVTRDKTALDLAIEFAEKVRSAGKKVVIFFWSDSDGVVPIGNAVVFRTSMYRSKRSQNEFAMPSWGEDIVGKYLGGQLPIREKSARPVVGFCGFAYPLKMPIVRSVKNIVKRTASFFGIQLGKSKGQVKLTHAARTQALRFLSESSLVDTNFIIKDRFLGGAQMSDGRVDQERWEKAQREFVQNMVTSDYVLCSRGAGNFSYRLYEALSCGRIPVFIDTDCGVPYDFAVDWKRYCVWIDEGEIPIIARKVLEFHERLTPQEFTDLQSECRRIWETMLSPEGFFTHFHKHFEMTRDES
jgi:hypothetical protein